MGPTWKRDVYGTPEADTVKYDGLAVSAGDLVGTEKWNLLKNSIAAERARWHLSAANLFTASKQTKIVASGLNNLKNNIPNVSLSDKPVGSEVSAESYNSVTRALQKSGGTCVCNCAYCTCNCNYCVCNCDYECTCNCAYCTCNCNYCTCACAHDCVCNSNY